MTFKHGKFSDSPMMRAYERVAIKKGLVKPEEMVKTASVSLEPSDDLFSDILKLSGALRDRGFEKQADELENNIIMFKTAETHLYRAIDEDGEDLLQFAHPKGSTKMHPAKDNHGDVEDLLDQHEKILKVVNKTPTGKYASVVNKIAMDLGIKKKAEINDFGKMDAVESAARNVNAHYKNQLLKEFGAGGMYFYYYDTNAYNEKTSVFGVGNQDKKAVFPIVVNNSKKDGKVENSFLKFYLKANKITDEQFADYLDNKTDPQTIFSQDQIDLANSNLKTRYNGVLNKIKALPILPTNPVEQNYNEAIDIANKLKDGINGLFDEFSWFDFKGILANSAEREDNIRKKLVPALLKQADNYISAINEKFGQKTQQPENTGLLTNWWSGNVAGKFDKLKQTALDHNQDSLANEFMAIANVVRAGANKPFSETYNALVKLSADNAEFNDIHKLDAVAMDWENYFKNLKKASNKDGLVKEALTRPPAQEQTITAPVSAPVKTDPIAKSVPAKKPAMSEKEYNSVLSMQSSLHVLASALSDEKTAARIRELTGLDRENANKVIAALLGTGIGGKKHTDNLDGVWGPNTQNSLKAAKFLQDALSKNNPQLASKSEFTTDAQFNKGVSEKDVVDKADKNTSLINSLLANVGAGHLVPGSVNDLDKLPRTDYSKPDLMSKVNEIGDISLGQNDLNSFDTLYSYLTKNGLVPGVSFDRLTNEMKEGLPADVWENIVHFLRFRAYQQAKKHVEDKVAQAYMAATDKLYMALKPIMERITTNPYKDAKETILSPNDFTAPDKINAPKQVSDKKTPGDTRNISVTKEKDLGDGVNARFINDKPNIKEQPFDTNINLRELAKNYPNEMSWYNSLYGKLLSGKLINVQYFRQDPLVIADNILRDPTVDDLVKLYPSLTTQNIEWYRQNQDDPRTLTKLKDVKLRMFAKVIRALRQDLMAVRDAWEKYVSDEGIDTRLIQANNSAWNAWSVALSQLEQRITQSIRNVNSGTKSYYSY